MMTKRFPIVSAPFAPFYTTRGMAGHTTGDEGPARPLVFGRLLAVEPGQPPDGVRGDALPVRFGYTE
ncbi:protein of unknown function [Kyrpidia spormannii]|uniref:Uncharacterized protein n=2 Tax=Kyrpidia spormannii TaxID=2055160 RepID=A0ACA8Z588_9BACL|nr:protein of unknown function [Kyrpidia spormannii]CAB3390545.1 protein of unknown function [Kyrpidia spormannii]